MEGATLYVSAQNLLDGERCSGPFETWIFEPHAAEQVFESYVDEANVEVLFSRRL